MATVKGFWIGSSTAVGAVHTFSVYPNHAEITAETAIALLADKDKSFWVETGISGIVSDGKEETFEQPVPMIHRRMSPGLPSVPPPPASLSSERAT